MVIEWSNGEPIRRTGPPCNILKLQLPMSVEVARAPFALLSIDGTLPKFSKVKQKRKDIGEESDEDDEIEEQAEIVSSSFAPSLLVPTVIQDNCAPLTNTQDLAVVDPSRRVIPRVPSHKQISQGWSFNEYGRCDAFLVIFFPP